MSLYEGIVGILISIGLIIAGLSGEFVLMGTNSSELLVIAGVILLILDLYYMFFYKKGESEE